jgi:hypothetical protein
VALRSDSNGDVDEKERRNETEERGTKKSIIKIITIIM